MKSDVSGTVAGIALALSSVAHGGPRVWTTGGPYGGAVQPLAIDPANPATLYAGTWYAGMFRSKDSGRTWAAVDTGLTNLNSLVVYALAVAPRNPKSPATLYAATSGGGVLKSTDSGLTWKATNTRLTELYVTTLAIDPTNPSTLYAGTGNGVFKSGDAGATWIAASAGLKADAFIHDLAIDPTNPATLYAGTTASYGGGGALVFKSTDAGATWAAASTGLSPKPYSSVHALPSVLRTLPRCTPERATESSSPPIPAASGLAPTPACGARASKHWPSIAQAPPRSMPRPREPGPVKPSEKVTLGSFVETRKM